MPRKAAKAVRRLGRRSKALRVSVDGDRRSPEGHAHGGRRTRADPTPGSGTMAAVTAFVLTLVGAALAVGLELLEAMAIVLAVGSTRRRATR